MIAGPAQPSEQQSSEQEGRNHVAHSQDEQPDWDQQGAQPPAADQQAKNENNQRDDRRDDEDRSADAEAGPGLRPQRVDRPRRDAGQQEDQDQAERQDPDQLPEPVQEAVAAIAIRRRVPRRRPGDARPVHELDLVVARVVQVAADLRAIQLEVVDPATDVATDMVLQRQAAR